MLQEDLPATTGIPTHMARPAAKLAAPAAPAKSLNFASTFWPVIQHNWMSSTFAGTWFHMVFKLETLTNVRVVGSG